MSNVKDVGLMAFGRRFKKQASYFSLLVPIILFFISLYISPSMYSDSGFGFLALRSMLEGGAFNGITEPDPANIANDVTTFLTWWSPGQYLVPGAFVWLGTDYGTALSLTAVISTVIGVIGWGQVARSFAVSPFVLSVFLFGLATFRYVTLPFRIYNGGEVLLFAVAPWCLYWMRRSINKTSAICFAISLFCAALLFVAKLTGLVVFGANVLAISLLELIRQRRVTPSIVAMWLACGIAALCFQVFWLSRGSVPAGGSGFAVTWPAIWLTASGAAFSGFSVQDLLRWLLLHPSSPILSDLSSISYLLGPLALFLMIAVWFGLRDTRYRGMAISLFAIIAIYMVGIATMNFRGAAVGFDERHFRYVGILFFLLLLVAVDQWRVRAIKGLALASIGAFAAYGLFSYANGAGELMEGRYYDPQSGTSQMIVSPTVLQFLRSEMTQHNWQNAIAVLPSPEAAISLPRFRIIANSLDFTPLEKIAGEKRAGHAEKIYVIVQRKMLENGKSEALLTSFVDYDPRSWSQLEMDGMVIYSQ